MSPSLPILASVTAALAPLRDRIIAAEESFSATTLEPRLQIGLQCLKAYQVFAINPGKGGRPKKTVTRDGISEPAGFEGWLAKENPWLKKATAYKYMEAVHGLGLTHEATPQTLTEGLDMLCAAGPVTLKSLLDRCPEKLAGKDASPEPQQTEFEFIRQNLSAFREEAETIIAIKDKLRAIPDAHRAACARAYTILRELTGSDWAPSDTPDSLATIDPDTFTL